MSDAFRCDRCGDYGEGAPKQVGHAESRRAHTFTYDVCGTCFNAFTVWLKLHSETIELKR